jgi:hypothetical protein
LSHVVTTVAIVVVVGLFTILPIVFFWAAWRRARRFAQSVGLSIPGVGAQLSTARSLMKTVAAAGHANAVADTEAGRTALASVVQQLANVGLNLDPKALARSVLVTGPSLAAQFRGGEQVDERRLDATGRRGRAKIREFRDLGVAVGESQVVDLDLAVTLPGKPEYPAKLNALVPRTTLGRLVRGMSVAVVVDASDDDHLYVDWSG